MVDSSSRDMEMQTWKRAAGHSLSAGIITDLAKKARSQLIREREKNVVAARVLDFLVCGACGWFKSPIGQQEARIMGMSRQQPDQSQINEGIRSP